MPICGHWLARSSILRFLLHLSMLALAISSQFFPYSTTAPKRIVFQHTFRTAGIYTRHFFIWNESVTSFYKFYNVFWNSKDLIKSLQYILFYYYFSTQMSGFCFPFSNFLQFSCDFAGSSQIMESTYDFSVLDSNSLEFIFKHSPEVAKILNVTSEFSFESASLSKRHDWMVSFVPILCKSFSFIEFYFSTLK